MTDKLEVPIGKRERLESAAPVVNVKKSLASIVHTKVDFEDLFSGLRPININEDDEISIKSINLQRRLSLGGQTSSALKRLNNEESENGSLINVRGRLTLENARLTDVEARIHYYNNNNNFVRRSKNGSEVMSQRDEQKKEEVGENNPMNLFIGRDQKVKKAFVIEVDDIYDVELMENLLDDPA
jgi:hypothetical protein